MPDPNRDPWRPQFHLSAPVGLINDPNGLIHWKEAHHIFFQWNPLGCTHENKCWGHARSADLVNWEFLPLALAPTERFESHGCYSGSAVADGDELVLVYTGNVRNGLGERETHQCLARSGDGIRFDKRGPVITGPSPGYTTHFRDPKVWRDETGWWMVLGVQTKDLAGTVLLLRSPDLLGWSVVGPILAAGQHGYMCECPDLFRIGGSDALIFCEQHHGDGDGGSGFSPNVAGVVIGRIDLDTGRFDHGLFHPLDHGRDFYAPQSWLAPDGRRLLIGWMGLPEQTAAPTVDAGWMHCLTIPRELALAGDRLHQRPARELAALRGEERSVEDLAVAGKRWIDGLEATACEIRLDLAPEETGDLALVLRAAAGEPVTLAFLRDTGEIRLHGPGIDGRISLLGLTVASRPVETVTVFVDRSSIEVFIDGGDIVLSARTYPHPSPTRIGLRSEQGARVLRLTHWPLGKSFSHEKQTCRAEQR
ncbi:glycoside hydrolase family 32 protein [Azospirillum sp. A29]|uniref:glycoside hydrolase family 32 protein n=1 Tax=unclassified Azospirillum TaxID=2630922 RepID=UPI0036700D42